MKKHQKHTALTRPNFGNFSRQEWAILGTNCGSIQKLSRAIIKNLSNDYDFGYVDADHKNANDEMDTSTENALNSGANLEYMDMIDYHRFDTKNEFNQFQYRQWFKEQDAVLINGNHFKGKKQIVVIDQKKKDSLNRKLDRLTDVQMILFTEGETEVYDFLKEHLANWKDIPSFQISQVAEISNWIAQQLVENIPPVYGLVLAGGKSQRMGKDKAALNYHGVPQVKHVHGLLSKHTTETFISCREDQVDQFSDFKIIKDSFTGLGPFGAIVSAFRENPNAAWLVMAVDLPLVDAAFLKELISQRNFSKNATAFLNPATDFPDPLLTIWEPRSYSALLGFLAQGYSCPRKVLINSDIELIETSQSIKLKNVNNPEDFSEVMKILEKEDF